jgi:hypothetical protein
MPPDPKDAPFPTKQLIILGMYGGSSDVIVIGAFLTTA